MNVATWWGDTDRRGPKYWDKKPFQALCPPQIPHGLVWDWSCVFAARGQGLTAWSITANAVCCYNTWREPQSLFKCLPVQNEIKLIFRTPAVIWLLYREELTYNMGRLKLKCDGTRWRTGGEVKGKLTNEVGSQYSSHYLGTWCIQHYYLWCAHLGCQ